MSSAQNEVDQDVRSGWCEAGSTASRLLLGAQLRRLRESAGISQEDAAHAIQASASKISRLEMGRVRCKPRDVGDLLGMYGVEETGRATLLALASQANEPAWWHPFRDVVPGPLEDYLGLEPSACLIRTYDVQFIPTLLRTTAYSLAIQNVVPGEAGRGAVKQRAGLAARRQQMLHRPDPPRLWAVIDEAALPPPGRRPACDARPARASHRGRPAGPRHHPGHAPRCRHRGRRCPLHHAALPPRKPPDVVYLEQVATACYLSRPAETAPYLSVLNLLAANAEPPSATTAILQGILAGA